jgi:hypothetical protein
MNSHDFVAALKAEVVDANMATYSQLLRDTSPDKTTDPYWRASLALYGELTDGQRESLLRIVRQVAVDTVSNILGILDGSTPLIGLKGDLRLTRDSEQLDGSLQEEFLEMTESD